MADYLWTSGATVLTMLMYFWVTLQVGLARGKYNVKAPATSGCVEFDCAFRVQQNTLEQAVWFLPSLWMFAAWQSDLWAGALGAVWVVGRVIYAIGYNRAPEKRSVGFSIAMLANLALLLGAVGGWGMTIFG